MARFAVAAKFNGSGDHDIFHVPDAINGSTTASTQATVAADIATLVADGASPTQAHVTTLNTDWAAFIATLGTLPAKNDVVVSVNTTAVTTLGALRAVMATIIKGFAGGILK